MQVLDDIGYIELVRSCGGDYDVVADARMSVSGKDVNPRRDTVKLIDYLMKHQHTTPFEGVTATFEVKCPIFIARQWMRHRAFSYNEMSARYGAVPAEYYVPEKWRVQSNSNKQASGADIDCEDTSQELHAEYLRSIKNAIGIYEVFLEAGVSRELARTVLPQSMYTKFRVTGNLHNYMHFMKLRNSEHAQYEIQEYAKAMETLLMEVAPISMEAWKQYVKK